MNKEEFQTKKNDIDSKIRELKSQKIKLEKEYIKSNAKYPIGSKVCITTPASTYIRLDNHESVSRVYHTSRINALTIPDKHFFSH